MIIDFDKQFLAPVEEILTPKALGASIPFDEHLIHLGVKISSFWPHYTLLKLFIP
eukprot:CAMPEP_0197343722 /NCGR_PEP_ID=MMETSP0893-20130614/979_1 /TAXON_ID=44058 ORGANISM="Aureoumbra lagunensis, Strain CCMP1510" /NCGR_SAMPLE_ID=MMETSP0893 /ASSEMBLY_ACC=CAM_ASM_000539 /LENGTH=54 /DNA_ID=CAMNT_0042849613 /DNA_START=1 /DNA_END=165 /DNA_ORIENTATION=-